MGEIVSSITDKVIPISNSSVWTRAQVNSVVDSVETVVLTHTVTSSELYLDELSMTGTFAAEFRVYLNNSHKETKRIEISEPVATAEYSAHKLVVGDVVEVRVVHYNVGQTHSFESTIKGHR